jgi:hypothetical protein
MPDYDLEDDFPNLRESGWAKTSDRDTGYNCIAWGLYDTRQWWELVALPIRGYYWPPGVDRDDTTESWIRVFEIHGYRRCQGAEVEEGFEKVAIYAINREPTHVARQLVSGQWTSKLGMDEDITHSTLRALEGENYGTVELVLRRKRS